MELRKRAGSDSKRLDSVMVPPTATDSDSVLTSAPASALASCAGQVSSLQKVDEGIRTEGEQSGEKSCTVHPVRSMSDGNRPNPGNE